MNNQIYKQALEVRKTDYPVKDFLLGRWSPRAMTGEALSNEHLMTLFDAARWAPSAYNEQPWRFTYATAKTEGWNKLNALLGEWNQQWCANAGALVLITATKKYQKNDKPNPTFAFDTGAAWMALALQGASMGLVVHGMSGFDYEQAAELVELPEDHEVIAMFAVGYPSDKNTLPEDMQEGETPSGRMDINEFTTQI